MGFGGIIAGALGGALGGAGQAVAEDARNTMKQEGEMSLLQAKERLQQQRETALANINNDAAMARTNVDQEGATKRTQMTNDTSVKTTQMNNDTSRADAQLQAQTSLQVAKMHEAGADRRTQAEIAGALDRMSVGQRFTTSDGTVLEKGADKTWKTITDPTTGQPAKGVNPEQRDALRARAASAEKDVQDLQKQLNNEISPTKKKDLQAKVDAAMKTRDDLLRQLSGASTVPASTSGTITPANRPPLSQFGGMEAQ
ncbi:MAG: hypothetical protein ACXWHZ_03535 [Usitatibacter sp.]